MQSSTRTQTTDNIEKPEDLKEIEVAAQITVPPDGGWGWVVVMTSFFVIAVADGTTMTFGCIYGYLLTDLNLGPSLVSLINSVTVSSCFLFGPIVSALINRFGFRTCVMTGSAMCAISCCLTFTLADYTALLFFYGLVAGFGFSLMSMSSLLIVGFYFQKWRAIAFTIAVTGSSFGVIVSPLIYSETAEKIGWQYTILLQSSVAGLCFFMAFALRPLLSMTVIQTTIVKQDQSVALLKSVPALSIIKIKPSERRLSTDDDDKKWLFRTETNIQFPTAAEVITELSDDTKADASIDDIAKGAPEFISRLTMIPHNASFHGQDLEDIKTLLAEAISRGNIKEGGNTSGAVKSTLAITIQSQDEGDDDNTDRQRRESVKGVFNWERHVVESRPMYRDDAFLHDVAEQKNEEPVANAIEYQLKVSRVAALHDLMERRGVFTTAFKRVLVTMLHPKLLGRKSFILCCLVYLLFYCGYLIPFIFITERGKKMGIPIDKCKFFISAIGFAGILGRFMTSLVVAKVSPLTVVCVSHFIAGIATFVSSYTPQEGYQIAFCLLFGLVTSGSAITRSLIIVKLYGLENLTNCTGMIYLFIGIGSLFSPPLAGFLQKFDSSAPFAYAGISLVVSAIVIIPIAKLVDMENNAATDTRSDAKSDAVQDKNEEEQEK